MNGPHAANNKRIQKHRNRLFHFWDFLFVGIRQGQR